MKQLEQEIARIKAHQQLPNANQATALRMLRERTERVAAIRRQLQPATTKTQPAAAERGLPSDYFRPGLDRTPSPFPTEQDANAYSSLPLGAQQFQREARGKPFTGKTPVPASPTQPVRPAPLPFNAGDLRQAPAYHQAQRGQQRREQQVLGTNVYNPLTRKPQAVTGEVTLRPEMRFVPYGADWSGLFSGRPGERFEQNLPAITVNPGKEVQGILNGRAQLEEAQRVEFEQFLLEQVDKRPEILPPFVGTGQEAQRTTAHINEILGTGQAFDQYREHLWAKYYRLFWERPTRANWKSLYPQAKSHPEAMVLDQEIRAGLHPHAGQELARRSRMALETLAPELAYTTVKAWVQRKTGRNLTPIQGQALRSVLAWEIFRLPDKWKVDKQTARDIETTVVVDRIMDAILPGSGTVRKLAGAAGARRRVGATTLRGSLEGAAQQTATRLQVDSDVSPGELVAEAATGALGGAVAGGALGLGGEVLGTVRGARMHTAKEGEIPRSSKIGKPAPVRGSATRKELSEARLLKKRKPDLKTTVPAATANSRDAAERVLPPLPQRVKTEIAARREEALKRISANANRLHLGLDPDILRDYAEIGASYIAEGATRFEEWSKKAIGDGDQLVRKNLRQLWKVSRDFYNAHYRTRHNLPHLIEEGGTLRRDDSAAKGLGRGEYPTGPHGPILAQFRYKPDEAVRELVRIRSGEAPAALHHPDVGDIDLIWGEEGKGPGTGFGLAKIAARHPEVLANLQEFIANLPVVRRTNKKVYLEKGDQFAVISLDYQGNRKRWLLTAYVRGSSRARRTMDVPSTPETASPAGRHTPPPADEPANTPSLDPDAGSVKHRSKDEQADVDKGGIKAPTRGTLATAHLTLSRQEAGQEPLLEPSLAAQLPPGQKVRHITGLREAADWLPWFVSGGGQLPREIKAGAKEILAEGRGPYSVMIELDPRRVTGRQLHAKSEVYG